MLIGLQRAKQSVRLIQRHVDERIDVYSQNMYNDAECVFR